MPELPRISGREAIKVFERMGFVQTRQRGSHVVLRRGDVGCCCSAAQLSGRGHTSRRDSSGRFHAC